MGFMKKLKLQIQINPLYSGMNLSLNQSKTLPIYEWEASEKWLLKIKINKSVKLIAFPYFNTIAIGFLEQDNRVKYHLGYTNDTETIYEHIKKCALGIEKEIVIEAIRLMQFVLE
jgi:hypothetical protein